MQYRINFDNYRNFGVLEINKLEPRAYFIPYSDKAKLKATDFRTERYESDKVTVLSGDWDFKFYQKESMIPEVFDTDAETFDTIKVPSTWQRTGYMPPIYLNVRYEFDTFPPGLPEDLATGIYRKKITIDNLDKNYILTFLGVISSLDLYVNGKHIGYSEGAHNSAEFDITKHLHVGENELVAVVFRYSTGTYLECQDMFRETGIFRDVLLTAVDKTYIYDYQFKTKKVGDRYNLDAQIEVEGDVQDYSVEIEITKNDEVIAVASAPAAKLTEMSFDGLEVEEWTAETPNLYETYVTLKKDGKDIEVLKNLTGFKTIKIIGNVFTFNGQKIKFKGVNHHDTHPVTGYVMTVEDLEKDIKLMKSLNVNAVRTSHYPPDPHLLILANIYGLYVVDEADIETHGIGRLAGHSDYLSHDFAWANRYLDRVKRMYMRDRNHPSITMWSLGNEAGGYNCQDVCYYYLHEVCPEIPVHYEGVCRTDRFAYDVTSEMYTRIEDVARIKDGTRGEMYSEKPFFLCEYAHAMGEGPGSLHDYWDVFYAADNLMGGCIWEWADHSVYDENAKYKYTYGGDHGEVKHDGAFCVDGLVYPDRTPHTGAYEMKAVYRPVIAKFEKGKFIFTNTNRFVNSSYLTLKWQLLENGIVVDSGNAALDIAPTESKSIEIAHAPIKADKEYHINFIYEDANSYEVAKEQITLNQAELTFGLEAKTDAVLNKEGDCVVVAFENGRAVFDNASGQLISYVVGGKELLNTAPIGGTTGFVTNIFRAMTDNDIPKVGVLWRQKGFDRYTIVFDGLDARLIGGKAELTSKYSLVVDDICIFKSEITHSVAGNGVMEIHAKLTTGDDEEIPFDLPRFGLSLELPRSFENVEYYGLGERENLPDFYVQSIIGIYESSVADLHEDYIRPQENGNHGETKWMKITDGDGNGFLFCNGAKGFSFNARHYTQQLLCEAQHREDLYDQNTTIVEIDGFIRGTGSGSCGPDTLPEYTIRTDNGQLEFNFTVAPICK